MLCMCAHKSIPVKQKIFYHRISDNRSCQFYVTSVKAKINQYFYVVAIWVE